MVPSATALSILALVIPDASSALVRHNFFSGGGFPSCSCFMVPPRSPARDPRGASSV
ncbi:hypothetical protein [Corynebacterium variabile]|uniref:hypothetical protein n=1 Tax=Corynebacterium variabile TaxID=1727 RepID=UPI00289C7680|nr:hypothetical protein [Corynebacterium variabile]